MSSQSHSGNVSAVYSRSCFNVDGSPKKSFASFDDAHGAAMGAVNLHAYRCHQHGWHLGRNTSRTAQGYRHD